MKLKRKIIGKKNKNDNKAKLLHQSGSTREGDNGIKSTAKFYTEIIFTVKIDSLA
jgi:hypothetical protein